MKPTGDSTTTDAELWRKHNLDELRRDRAMSFEDKVRWLEETEQFAEYFRQKHELSGVAEKLRLAQAQQRSNETGRAAEEPPPAGF